MRVGGQLHSPVALPPGKRPGTHCVGGWVGPRAGLDGCGKSRLHRDSIPDRPARSESLYWLSYHGPRPLQREAVILVIVVAEFRDIEMWSQPEASSAFTSSRTARLTCQIHLTKIWATYFTSGQTKHPDGGRLQWAHILSSTWPTPKCGVPSCNPPPQ